MAASAILDTARRCMAKSRHTPSVNSAADTATDAASVSASGTMPAICHAAR